jgi:hypothetical protein
VQSTAGTKRFGVKYLKSCAALSTPSLQQRQICYGAFETICPHFEHNKNVLEHHTASKRGHLRLAIRPGVPEQKRSHNFATLSWQNTKQVLVSTTNSNPDDIGNSGSGLDLACLRY